MARIVFCVLLLVVCCSENVFSQAARSPFSSTGIGENYGAATANQQGMAGVGVSNPSYLFINNLNPALLVFNGMQGITTFQAGILGEQRNRTDGVLKEKSKGGNLNYLLLAFPIKSGKWVTSVGLMPYSAVRYSMRYSEPVANAPDTALFIESGHGGINQVAWSHGIALHRYLSVGARASYLYSSIENVFSNTVQLANQTTIFNPEVHQRYYYKGFAFTGSVSVHIDSLFDKDYRFNFGAVYDLKSSINTDYLQTLIRTDASLNAVGDPDTIRMSSGKTTIPSTLSAGISFGKAHVWTLAVDGRMSDYGKFGFYETQQSPTTKTWRVAAGFELTPNPASLGNYLKVITYRVGASTEQLPYLVNGKPVKDLGANFGLSLPVARGCSLDLSGRWGQRGTVNDNALEEKYFKLFFGVTFNDRWFIKRRFD